MGNATLQVGGGVNTNTSHSSGAETWWPSGTYAVSTEEMYIDGAYLWGHAVSGTVSAVAGIYNSGGAEIGAASNSTSGWGTNSSSGQWQGSTWSPANFIHIAGSGTSLLVGVCFSGAWTVDSDGGSGGYLAVGGSTLNTNWTNGASDAFGHCGYLGQQISYYKKCAISSVDSGPFAVGQVFNVHGNSFGNGSSIVTSVTLNGVSCSYTWVSDSQLQVTVPAGATTGTVTVNTYAGSATSSGTVTVSSAYVLRSGTWTPAAGGFVDRTNVQTQATEIAVMRSTVWTPGA